MHNSLWDLLSEVCTERGITMTDTTAKYLLSRVESHFDDLRQKPVNVSVGKGSRLYLSSDGGNSMEFDIGSSPVLLKLVPND